MGNKQQSLPQTAQGKSIYPPHPMLNNTKLVKINNQVYLRSQWPFFNQENYSKWTKNYQSFLEKLFNTQELEDINHSILTHLVLPVAHSYQKVNICSPSGIVTMQYLPLEHTLVDDIEKRSKNNDPYLENDLWKLLRTLTKVVTFLHQKDITINDLRCQNIFIDLTNKTAKIATEVSWIGEWSLSSKIENKCEVFTTPELLDVVSCRKPLTTDILKVNDDFQIGMVLSEAILLQDLSKIYEFKNNTKSIQRQKINELIERLFKISYYPLKLLLLVAGLIQYDASSRISSSQLCTILKLKQKEPKIPKADFLTKEHFLKIIPKKYKHLQSIFSNIKGQSSFHSSIQGQQLLKSNVFTINQISNVPIRKTVDETSVDLYTSLLRDATTHRTILADPNLYQRPTPELDNTKPKHRYITGSKPQQTVSKYNITYANHQPQIKIDDYLAVSDVKQYQMPNMQMPSSHNGHIVPTKLYAEEDPKSINQNFSFHNLVKSAESPRSDFQIANYIQQIRSTQTLLITPSVYSVSNPPQSYISYHYTKSISQNQPIKIKDDSKSYEASFQFQPEVIPANLKKYSQKRPSSNVIHDNFNEPRRRTIGSGAWDIQHLQDHSAL